MITDADRAEILAMIRDEIIDSLPDHRRPLDEPDRAALTFEIRFLRREIEHLTQQLHDLNNATE